MKQMEERERERQAKEPKFEEAIELTFFLRLRFSLTPILHLSPVHKNIVSWMK